MAAKPSCRDAAIRLIAYRDRTENELYERLGEKGYSEKEIAEAMAFAAEYGFINDREYAKKFIGDGLSVRNHGLSRIKTELLRKGIDRGIVEEEIALARENAETDPREIIAEIIERRFSDADMASPKERNRIFGYFARRGYSPNEIWSVINEKRTKDDIDSEEFE